MVGTGDPGHEVELLTLVSSGTWEIRVVGYTEASAVGGLLWPHGTPAHIMITALTVVTEPTQIGDFQLAGVGLDDINQMEPAIAARFLELGIGEQPLPPPQPSPPTPAPAPAPYQPPPQPPPVPSIEGFQRWEPYIAAGNVSMIKDVAAACLAGLASMKSIDDMIGGLTWASAAAGMGGAEWDMFPIRWTKPEWWDSRGGVPAAAGAHRRNALIDRAHQLLHDYQLTVGFVDEHVTQHGSDYLQLIEEMRLDHPDVGRVRYFAGVLANVRFILDETGRLAVEVEHLADAAEG